MALFRFAENKYQWTDTKDIDQEALERVALRVVYAPPMDEIAALILLTIWIKDDIFNNRRIQQRRQRTSDARGAGLIEELGQKRKEFLQLNRQRWTTQQAERDAESLPFIAELDQAFEQKREADASQPAKSIDIAEYGQWWLKRAINRAASHPNSRTPNPETGRTELQEALEAMTVALTDAGMSTKAVAGIFLNKVPHTLPEEQMKEIAIIADKGLLSGQIKLSENGLEVDPVALAGIAAIRVIIAKSKGLSADDVSGPNYAVFADKERTGALNEAVKSLFNFDLAAERNLAESKFAQSRSASDDGGLAG